MSAATVCARMCVYVEEKTTQFNFSGKESEESMNSESETKTLTQDHKVVVDIKFTLCLPLDYVSGDWNTTTVNASTANNSYSVESDYCTNSFEQWSNSFFLTDNVDKHWD